ncbi:hypothetical protein HAX54_048747 [Datura stramonium]|uniref:Uncharacterized protein n=1 Tax=Datura stramonium TaxID=4076 RepID=A0ABS8RR74_DATST|nr:hypothetical protein [Datura stramonium]
MKIQRFLGEYEDLRFHLDADDVRSYVETTRISQWPTINVAGIGRRLCKEEKDENEQFLSKCLWMWMQKLDLSKKCCSPEVAGELRKDADDDMHGANQFSVFKGPKGMEVASTNSDKFFITSSI